MTIPDPERIQRIADSIAERGRVRPEALVVLGSGLARIADEVRDAVDVPFDDLPDMPPTSVSGHEGRFVIGRLGGLGVLLQSGRFHAYEGHGPDVLALPVRVAAELGASILVATNAAGGVREDLEPGDLVVLEDHLNLQGRNPLVGPVRAGEPRFPDMTGAYDRHLRETALREAERRNEVLKTGVYGAVLGPSFETPAEVRMLAALGVDVVGMSTVPEVVTARARGMRCLAFSMVTNLAAGRSEQPLSHEEVLEVGGLAGVRLGGLVSSVLATVAAEPQSGDAR